MAGIDYTIPGQFKPIQIESPVNQMAAMAQLQGLQQQQQMNALKAQEYQRGVMQRNALARIHSDPNIKPGSPEYLARVQQEAPDLYENVATRALQQADLMEKTAARKASEEKTAQETRAKKLEEFRTAQKDIAQFNSVDEVIADIQRKKDAGLLPEEHAQYILQGLPTDPNQFGDWKNRTLMSLVSAEKQLELNKPMVVAPGGQLVDRSGKVLHTAPARENESDLARLQRERAEIAKADAADPRLKDYDAAIAKATATNSPLSDLARKQNELVQLQEQLTKDPNNKDLQKRIKQYESDLKKDTEWKPPVTNLNVAAPVTPVTIQDPNDPSKAIVVDGRTGKVIGASVKEGPGVDLTAKERQAREAKYPQATAAIKTYESKSEALAKDLEKLANHPGLSGISGMIFGRTPSGTKDSMAAQALYDSIVARGGFKELQDMRAASPTGGALGNVSNQEGQYLRDAFAPISRTQATPDLSAALKNAAGAVRDSKGRIREAYDLTYEYRSGNTPSQRNAAPPPPPGFVPEKK